MEVLVNLELKVGDVLSMQRLSPPTYVYVVLGLSGHNAIMLRTMIVDGKTTSTIETFSHSHLRSRWIDVGWEIL